MKLKKIVLLALVLVLLSATVVVGFRRPAVAEGVIYIMADGSVMGTDKIQRDGNVYTFIDNLYGSIVVERDNIVVDGAGYVLQGTESEIGIALSERINVSIRNMEIYGFFYGVYLLSSLNSNLTRNNIANNAIGICLTNSSNNNVSGNNITYNRIEGILFDGSSNNNVSGDNIKNNSNGIGLSQSSNNAINENNVTGNIYYGIWLSGSSNNMFRNNDVDNNKYNFGVYGSLMQEFIQDIDDSNTANGKPVYYWVNRQDVAVPLDAGWVALVICTGITVKDLNITNNGQGILLAHTTDSTITKNNITNNYNGIWLLGSSDNAINENRVTENTGCGIYLYYSSNNAFFHNYFINNSRQVSTYESDGVWDNGVAGNYWSDYEDRYPNATELDGSGIWNTPYVIDEDNQDNYPLTNPIVIPAVPDTTPPAISIVSPKNNTYIANDVSLIFAVSEPTSWIGYSLDGQTIVAITENTTLVGLSDGSHSLKVYAKDAAGNTGASETIYFSIKTQQSEPFPVTWIVATIVIIAMVGAVLLAYFAKVKKIAQKAE
ncbi:MAG: right-handed parallel beta-helix repeat-containing protein [Candidatus Bathyarchaeota archaeon]|nr:right-handed parallel beta-helix repeat-containing protein [Candidatus Bathyarchaeota archaeon]MDH5595197.1 right-handed parallel beta-helix repeat-containing protein [Candidatus Bathyarchaeota archaeon]